MRYRHFKGGYYQVIDLAFDSETSERLVIYKSEKDGATWVRPLANFNDFVEIDGVKIQRFMEVPKNE